MPLAPAITDLDQLKNHPAVARVVGWKPEAVTGVKFDRDEMTIFVDRAYIREACIALKDDPACPFNFLSDVTCVDWYPAEPRFEVVYHLLSIPKKERVRLKVHLTAPARRSSRSLRSGPEPTISNAKCSTCSAFVSPGILIYAAS